MKIFFASVTNPGMAAVDAWVATVEEGVIILDALRKAHSDHFVIMRARVKRHSNREERYLGMADAAEPFMGRAAALATEGATR